MQGWNAQVLAALEAAAQRTSTGDWNARVLAALSAISQALLHFANLDWTESVIDELNMVTTEPAAPTEGDRHLCTATGNTNHTHTAVVAGRIYQWDGIQWLQFAPTEGAVCMVEARNMLIGYNGAAWVDIGTFALLAEAQTFFAATDITGAEAETLSSGAGSNADALHTHTGKENAGVAAGAVSAHNGLLGAHNNTVVHDSTHVLATPYAVLAADHNKTFDNAGAAAKIYFGLLLAAAEGQRHSFYCADADGLRITAAAGETIRLAGIGVTIAAGYIESTTVGSYVALVRISATEWLGVPCFGTWDVEDS